MYRWGLDSGSGQIAISEYLGGQPLAPDTARAALDALAQRARDPRDPTTISYEAFMEWIDEDMLAEWVDGKIEVSSLASLKHQQIGGFLYSLFTLYARLYPLGDVLNAPFQIKLSRSAREPDVMFLAKEHRDRLRNTTLIAPPIWWWRSSRPRASLATR